MGEGQRFGRYDLLEPIAKGGMAEVFMARAREDVGFERIVAVKRILPNLAADEEFVSMFIDEAKIAVQLNHASIAQIYDLGMADDHYYIALEYIHGRDLRALTNAEQGRGGAVPIDIACFIIMKVAEALDYAHRAEGRDGQPLNVIHRDVSPQNVIVSFEGDVKVIDFGLAKAAGRATQTQAGILKGKLAYLSPEQAHGDTIDYRSDIYALGILLFELLTGQRLFLKDNDIDTVMAVRSGEVPDPRTIAGDISDELAAAVLKALAREPKDRYQRAQELADELEAVLYTTGQPLSRRKVGEYMMELFPEDFMEEDEVQELLGVELIEDIPSVRPGPHPRIDEDELVDTTDLVPDEDDPDLFDQEEEDDRTAVFNPAHLAELEDATGPSPDPQEIHPDAHTTSRSSLPDAPEERTSRSSLPPPPAIPDLATTFELDPETGTVESPEPQYDASHSGVQSAGVERVTVEARLDDDADLVTSVGVEAIPALEAEVPTGDIVGTADADDAHVVQTVVAEVRERDTIPAPAPEGEVPVVTKEQMLSSAVQSLADLAPFVDDDEEEEDGTVVTAFSDDLTKPIDSDPDAAGGGSGRRQG